MTYLRPQLLPAFLAGIATICSSGSASADVLVVDALGPGPYFDIQPAVDAAADGDVILVRGAASVNYSSFEIDGKGLSVVGDPGTQGTPRVDGGFTVRNIPVASWAVIREIQVVEDLQRDPTAFLLEDCAGDLWLEDVAFSPEGGVLAATPFPPRVRIDSCDSVTLVRLDGVIETAPDITIFFLPPDAFLVCESTVTLLESTIEAFDSTDEFANQGPDGGSALVVVDSEVLAGGSTFSGGKGQDGVGTDIVCGDGGQGGAGVRVDSGTFEHLDSVFVGGSGGFPGRPGCGSGGPGPPISGTAFDLSTALRTLEAASPVRAGSSGQIHIETLPGELPILLTSARPSTTRAGSLFFGNLLVELVPTIVVLNTAPSGSVTLDVPWPPLPPGVSSLEFFSQLLVLDPSGNAILGSGSVLHVVDPTF